MSREILFRGKTENGEWVYGSYFQPVPSIITHENKPVDGIDTYPDYSVIPETVGQFTGLTDKNGKRIFEGDIVKTNIIYSGLVNVFIKEEIVEVKYIDGCFYPLYDYEKRKIEVIGNIHDNPELWEGADETDL